MIITKKHLSRRTFLQGTFGAAMALPLLDAMVPALTAQSRTAANSPFRFGAVYLPNGVFPETWHPAETGSNFQFKPVMQPLEPHRERLVTISKLTAPWGASIHRGPSAAFRNGVGPVAERNGNNETFGKIQSKKTVDQYIADTIAGDTPMRSIEVGTEVRVLLEDVEGDTGLVKISKRKADRIINWEAIMKSKKEGDPVSGKVTKKIKGGLLVDIGVPVFLPASQVDVRRPGDIGEFIGQNIRASILKIDTERRNIVISRRKLIEEERAEQRDQSAHEYIALRATHDLVESAGAERHAHVPERMPLRDVQLVVARRRAVPPGRAR